MRRREPPDRVRQVALPAEKPKAGKKEKKKPPVELALQVSCEVVL